MSHRLTTRNAEIVIRYNDGESIREIAAALGVTFQRVHQILVREGVVLRKRGKFVPVLVQEKGNSHENHEMD